MGIVRPYICQIYDAGHDCLLTSDLDRAADWSERMIEARDEAASHGNMTRGRLTVSARFAR